MTNITGMRMFLRLKVEPQAGQTLPSTEAKRRKMRLALRKILSTTSKGNDVDIFATFTNTNSSRPYHFVIATVTSTPGNDIKEATKRASSRQNLSSGVCENTGADQPAHPRRLISAFVIRFLESTICKLGKGEISIF